MSVSESESKCMRMLCPVDTFEACHAMASDLP